MKAYSITFQILSDVKTLPLPEMKKKDILFPLKV